MLWPTESCSQHGEEEVIKTNYPKKNKQSLVSTADRIDFQAVNWGDCVSEGGCGNLLI